MDTNKFYNSSIVLICGEEEKRINIIPKDHFCFSDKFIDITFIELKGNEYDTFHFLKVEEINTISDSVYAFSNLKEKKISVGSMNENYGFKIYHNVLLNNDHIGSALVSQDNNKIIGICTNKMAENDKKESLNVAIDVKYAIKSIRILFDSYSHDKTAFIKKEDGYIQKDLKILNDKEIKELKDHGLESTSIPELFISPKTLLVTQLWFYRTIYAWYWTPVEPKDNNFEISNWLIICPECSLKAVGSEWNGKEPNVKNIDLIHWLESTGLNYLV